MSKKKPIGTVSVKTDRNPQDFLANDDQPVDIRIYLSPKALALTVTLLVIIGRLIETIIVVVSESF